MTQVVFTAQEFNALQSLLDNITLGQVRPVLQLIDQVLTRNSKEAEEAEAAAQKANVKKAPLEKK